MSRQWKDTPSGVELSFWASTAHGPLLVKVPETEAVCFIERSQSLALPPRCRRQPVELKLLHGEPVDALYFRQQRELAEFRQLDHRLNESDIKPTDRFLMERFITAGFCAEGNVTQRDGWLEMQSPRLTPSGYLPELKVLSIDIETRGLSDQLYSVAGFAPCRAAVFMLGTEPDQQREGYQLFFCKTEKALLQAFFRLAQSLRSGCHHRLECGQL